MKEELQHTLLNGEPDILKRVEKWHLDKIKANNRQWYLLFVLTSIIWTGYICILKGKQSDLEQENNYLKHNNFINDSIIEMQKNKLDSAVFFKDIIVK